MKASTLFLYTGMAISLAYGTFATAARIWEPNPLAYHNDPFDLPQRVYKPGDEVTFRVERCAARQTEYSFSSVLINVDTGEKIQLPGANAVAERACEVITSVPKELPQALPEGKYYFEFTVKSEGLFKEFTQVVTTDYFFVRL